MENCTRPGEPDTELSYWRNHLFATTVLYLIPFSIIVLIPGVYMAWISEFYLMLAIDFIVVVSVLVIAFHPSYSIKFRKIVLYVSLYLIAIGLLYYLGSFGPGLLYLLAITMFVTLVYEFRYAAFSFILNTLICIVIGVLIYYDIGGSLIVAEYAVDQWIGVSVNLVFLSAVTVLLIPRLFKGFRRFGKFGFSICCYSIIDSQTF